MFFDEPKYGSKLRDFPGTFEGLRHLRSQALDDADFLQDNFPFVCDLKVHQLFIIKPSESVSELNYK